MFWNFGLPSGMPTGQMPTGQMPTGQMPTGGQMPGGQMPGGGQAMPQGQMGNMGTGLPTGQFGMPTMPQQQPQGQFQVQDLQAQLQANLAAQAQLQAQMQAQAQQMQACSGQVWPGTTGSASALQQPAASGASPFMQPPATSPPPPPPGGGGAPGWPLNTASNSSPAIVGNSQVVGQGNMPPARQKGCGKGGGKGKHDRDFHRDYHHRDQHRDQRDHRDHRDQRDHRDHRDQNHHQSSSGEHPTPPAPRPNPNQEPAQAAAAPAVAKRPALSKQQRELRSGDFLVRRAAASRAGNQVREVLTQTAACQRRIADVTKEIEGAKDKASKSQDLHDRAQASHAQHFYMMQEADRLFNEAAGGGAGAAGAAESLLEALAKCAASLGIALDTLQAILRKQDMMLIAEKSRQLVKQVDSAVQRSMASLSPAKQRLVSTKDSHDAKGMSTACQQVKTIVFQITLSAGSLMQGASLAQEVATSLEKKAVNVSKTKVPELSNMPGPARTPLPIDESRDEIVAAIKTRAVTCVQGETGCGKSSRVPQYIYSYCRGAAQYLRGGEGERIILCIQPRQLAAVSLAKHVAKEMGEAKVGGLVGYRTLGESCADSKKTKIMYISLDLLLQELLEVPGRIRGYSHIIFDEVHERSVDADLLSLFLKIHLQNRIADFKLIIMSATFEEGIYSNYFQDDNEVIAPPPALNAGGRNFDLDVLYLEDLLPFSKALSAQDDVCSLADEMRQLTGRALQGSAVAALEAGLENFNKLMKQFKQLEKSKTQTTVSQLADFGLLGSDAESEFWRTHPDFVPSLTSCPAPLVFLRPQIQRGLELTTLELVRVLARGGESFLIILPGPNEVAEFYDLFLSLGEDTSKMGCSFEVLALPTAASTPSYAAALLEEPKASTCRVYLASKAAESSLTLPKVKIAIDFCLRQATVQDQTRRQLELPLSQWTSRASTAQRGGRVGRSAAGLVLRMVPRDFYEAVLPAYDTPDMEQASLQRLYLQLKVLSEKLSTSAARLGVLPPRRLAQLAVQPPVADRLENATRALVEAGALTHKSDELGRLTILGRLAAMLPLELRFCRLLVFGTLFGCAADAVVMAVALQGQDPFTLPIGISAAAFGGKAAAQVHADQVKELIKSTKSREFFDDGALSEAVMLRNLFMTWLRGLETPPASETALSSSAEAFSLVPRSAYKRRSEDLASSHAVSAERLTDFAVGVADVAKRMLRFLPPETPGSSSPARASLQRMLADLGVCKRPASVAADTKVGEGLFCQDLLLLKSALTAAFAPHVASGVVNCIAQPPPMPAPRLAEGGGIPADPDLAVLHHQLLRDPDRFGGGARHCFAIPQVSEALRQNSNTWLGSMLDVLGAGKRKFKKMQIIQKDAFFLFDAGDSAEDSDSDLEETGSSDEIQLPETLQEVPLFEEEAAPQKASALGLLKGYDTSDSESEGKPADKAKKDKETTGKAPEEKSKQEDPQDPEENRRAAKGIDDNDDAEGSAGSKAQKKEEEKKKEENSDDELARIEQALDMEEKKALENSEQLQLKDDRKSKKQDKKRSKDKDKDKKKKKKKQRSRSRKNRRRSRSRDRERRRSSRSRSRRRRRSSSSSSSSSRSSSSSSRSERKPKTSRPAARPAVSASQLARAAAAAAAAFATGKASEGAKQDLLAATMKEGKAAIDRRNPLLSMLRSGGAAGSAASQGSVDTAFTGLTSEQKEKHQRRLDRLKAIQVAAEERQKTEMKIKQNDDSSSVMAKLKAREEKRKKREMAAAMKKDGEAGNDVVDISDSDEDLMVVDKPPPVLTFAIGRLVRAEGLTSASGRVLNGQIGKITYLPEGGRVEVEFSGDRILSLRAANLKVITEDEIPKDAELPVKSSKMEEPKGSDSPDEGESPSKMESAKPEAEKEKSAEPKADVEMEADFMDFMNDINSMDQEAAAAEKSAKEEEDVKMEDVKAEVKDEEDEKNIKMEDVKKESDEEPQKAKPEEVKVDDAGDDMDIVTEDPPPLPPDSPPPPQPASPPTTAEAPPPPPPAPAAPASSGSASPRALPPALTATSADLVAEAKRRALGQVEEPDPDDFLARIALSFKTDPPASRKEPEPVVEEKKDDDGLADLPLVEIKRRARSAGITVGSHMNDKEELIGLIREANKAAAAKVSSPSSSLAASSGTAASTAASASGDAKDSSNSKSGDMEASFAAFMSDLGSGEAKATPPAGATSTKSTTDDDFQAFLQAVDGVASASPASPPAGTAPTKEEDSSAAGVSSAASSTTATAASKGGMDDAFSAFMSEIGGLGGFGAESKAPEQKRAEAEAATAAATTAAAEAKPEPEAPLPEPSKERPIILVYRPKQWTWLVRSLDAADKTFPIGEGGPVEARQQALKFCRERQQELTKGQPQGTQSDATDAKETEQGKGEQGKGAKDVVAIEGNEVVCRGLGTNAMQLLKQLCGSCGGNGKSSPWPLGAEAPAPAHPFQMQWRVSFDGDGELTSGHRQPMYGVGNFRNPAGSILSCPSKAALEMLKQRDAKKAEELAAAEQQAQTDHQNKMSALMSSNMNPVEATLAMQAATVQLNDQLASLRKKATTTSVADSRWAQRCGRLAVFAGPSSSKAAVGQAALPLAGLTLLPTETPSSNALPLLLLLAFSRPRRYGGVYKGGCAALCDLDSKRLRAISLHGHREDARWVLPVLGKRRLTLADLRRANALRDAISAALAPAEESIAGTSSSSSSSSSSAKKKAPAPVELYLQENPDIPKTLGTLLADIGLPTAHFDNEAGDAGGNAASEGEQEAATPETAPSKDGSRRRQYGDVWIDILEQNAPALRDPLKLSALPKAASGAGAGSKSDPKSGSGQQASEQDQQQEQQAGPFFSFESSVDDIVKNKDGKEEKEKDDEADADMEDASEGAASKKEGKGDSSEDEAVSSRPFPTLTLPDAIEDYIKKYGRMRLESKEIASKSRAQVQQMEKKIRTLRSKVTEIDEGAVSSRQAWDLVWEVQDGDRDTVQAAMDLATHTLQTVSRMASEMAEIAQGIDDAMNQVREWEHEVDEGMEIAPQFWKPVVKVLSASKDRLKLHDQVMRAALKRSDEPRAAALYQADLAIQLVNEKIRRWADEEKILEEEAKNLSLQQEKERIAQQTAELERQRQQQELERQQMEMSRQREAAISWGRPILQQPVNIVFNTPGNAQPPPPTTRGAPLPSEQAPPLPSSPQPDRPSGSSRRK